MNMCVCVCVCVYGPAILFLAILYFSSKYNVSFFILPTQNAFLYFMFLKKIHSKLMMRHDDIIFNL